MNVRQRGDIQGLRAVAVLLVVLNHAGVAVFGGGYVGVDVFFVLSGFLITGLLLANAARTGYVSLADFYVRRARRILPAAALTLLATDLVAYFLLNVVRARQVMFDSIWAAFFAANVRFARLGTDYFAQWQPQSPIRHFWTLAVEEQFYLCWPALLSLIVFGSVRMRRPGFASESGLPPHKLVRLLVVTLIVTALSLVWSVRLTRASATDAYFSTFARAWELGLGVLLAIILFGWPHLASTKMMYRLRLAAGWVGLVCIGIASLFFSSSTLFPGYAALLPTGGAVLVIAAGVGTQSPLAASRVLGFSPLRYVGDRSYAFYLWHWPVLIIAVQYEGHDISVTNKLILSLGAFLLSILSYRFFENPLRRLRWPTLGGILMWPASAAIVCALSLACLTSLNGKTIQLEQAAAATPDALRDPLSANISSDAPLAAVTAAVRAARSNAPIPSSLTPVIGKLQTDGYDFPAGCAPNTKETKSTVCRLGDVGSSKTLLLMGDSFAQQWMPAILAMADRDGWLVIPLVNGSGCASSAWLSYPSRPWCPAWYRWAVNQAKALHPDVTLIAGEWGSDTPVPSAARGATALITSAKSFSRSVVVVGVPPLQAKQPVDCLLARGSTTKTCTTILNNSVASTNDVTVAAFAKKKGVGFMHPLGWFCARPSSAGSQYWCPLIINHTITRRDTGHITATYVKELAAPFRGSFRRALFG